MNVVWTCWTVVVVAMCRRWMNHAYDYDSHWKNHKCVDADTCCTPTAKGVIMIMVIPVDIMWKYDELCHSHYQHETIVVTMHNYASFFPQKEKALCSMCSLLPTQSDCIVTLFQYRYYYHSTLAIRAREWMHTNLKIYLLYTSYRSTSIWFYAYRYVYIYECGMCSLFPYLKLQRCRLFIPLDFGSLSLVLHNDVILIHLIVKRSKKWRHNHS